MRCSVYTETGLIRPIDAEKNTSKEMKRRVMSRVRKNEIILTCPCAIRLHSARLETFRVFVNL